MQSCTCRHPRSDVCASVAVRRVLQELHIGIVVLPVKSSSWTMGCQASSTPMVAQPQEQISSNKTLLQDRTSAVNSTLAMSFDKILVEDAPVMACSGIQATVGKVSARSFSFDIVPLDEDLPLVRASGIVLFTRTVHEEATVHFVDEAMAGMKSAEVLVPKPFEGTVILKAGEPAKDIDSVGTDSFEHALAGAPETFLQPTWCTMCGEFLWGVVDQGFRCSICSEARCPSCAKQGGHCHEYSTPGSKTVAPARTILARPETRADGWITRPLSNLGDERHP